ncbi:hypothetical protein NDU88_005598 [Pleurodeles waltl]|uniref:Uncharacterized protein n=1 Tax=Pleurodeles waltl TaxID=8319 RepID=A0AAV7VM21_PLEWA|nr:hypothetical protein NDU88_005598 [Pleurodeles waltl]
MLFPGRLRVVAPTGTEFFSTSEEAWAWLETHSAPDPNTNLQRSKNRQRPRSRRGQTAHRVGPPTPDEVQEERQWVMAEDLGLRCGFTSEFTERGWTFGLRQRDCDLYSIERNSTYDHSWNS